MILPLWLEHVHMNFQLGCLSLTSYFSRLTLCGLSLRASHNDEWLTESNEHDASAVVSSYRRAREAVTIFSKTSVTCNSFCRLTPCVHNTQGNVKQNYIRQRRTLIW